ncbi:hypothetical protein SAMN02910301_0528 [Lachnospiraceae bacterium XBD2001]|nr:hypothetical protein SAMN02910301_0528 [Lachnospiraceae bacterium XBD2001]
MGLFQLFKKKTLEDKQPQLTVEQIVDAFEKKNQELDEGESILFETGIYDFTGEKLFYFSLVKQYPNEAEEYVQEHTDILFEPDGENNELKECVWDFDLDDNIFAYIKNSKAYVYAIEHPYLKVNTYEDET